MFRIALTMLALFGIGFATDPLYGGERDFSARARELSVLRAEVESLEAELHGERERGRHREHGLQSQLLELELLIQREQVRLADLEVLVEERQEEREVQLAGADHLVEPLEEAIALLEQLVRDGIPFKREERLAELDEVRARVARRTLDPESAASRLWQFVEDELRLCEEVDLHRQVVEVDGVRTLSNVLRIGMLALFVEARDGYLRAQRDDVGWSFSPVAEGAATEALRALQESLRRQIRTGPTELPIGAEVAEGLRSTGGKRDRVGGAP